MTLETFITWTHLTQLDLVEMASVAEKEYTW